MKFQSESNPVLYQAGGVLITGTDSVVSSACLLLLPSPSGPTAVRGIWSHGIFEIFLTRPRTIHIYVTYMSHIWWNECVYLCVCVLSVQNFCWPECLRLNLLTICRKCPSNHIGLRTCQRPAQARHNLKSVLWMVTGEAFHRSDSCLCLLTNTDHSRVKGNARLELQARTVTLR